jgi:hypothetical protein
MRKQVAANSSEFRDLMLDTIPSGTLQPVWHPLKRGVQLMQAMAQALPQGQPGQLGATPELSMQQAQQTLANLAASFSGVAGASIAVS